MSDVMFLLLQVGDLQLTGYWVRQYDISCPFRDCKSDDVYVLFDGQSRTSTYPYRCWKCEQVWYFAYSQFPIPDFFSLKREGKDTRIPQVNVKK